MRKIKIIVGICGEGMGHCFRQTVVIQHLLDSGHKIKIISSGRAADFLTNKFPDIKVVKAQGMTLAYKNNQVDKITTLINNLKATKNLIKNTKLISQSFKDFKPDLVITDFDSAASAYAQLNDIPCIAIDNIQIINRCKIDKILKGTSFQLAKNIVKFKTTGCEKYFVTSFFDAEVKKKKTKIYQPIIRKQIIDAKIKDLDHVLVYQTSESNQDLVNKLKKIKDIVFVYGLKRDIVEDQFDDNIIYKPFSEKQFIKDLASSKCVVANGGFTLLSEAIYLKKPLYSFAIKNQFEQEMNAYYLEKLGYGKYCKNISDFDLDIFIKNIPFYKDNLDDYKHDNNEMIFKDLDKYIQELK